MRASQAGPAIGLIAQVLLLAVLAATAGLGAAGWVVGVACAVTMAAALARGLARRRGERLGPASWVTLARATLAVGVAALVADSFARDTPVALLVTLAAVALALDAVDGWVARRTGTATALGARFDGEVDAFLILALSVYVAPAYGAWVLAIGAARYLFLAGEWLLPWMRAPLPPRRWRRVVAAAQGIVLTVAAAEVLPRALMQALLVAALAALAASVGECVWWLWRRRDAVRDGPRRRSAERGPLRTGIAVALTVLALLLVWAALVAPDQPSRFTSARSRGCPLELLVVVAAGRAAARRPAPRAGRGRGRAAGVLVLVKVLDIGFFTAFDRPFDPVYDSGYVGIGIETLRDAIGRSSANLAVAGIVVLVVALLALPVLALLRVTRVAAGHRDWALPAAAVLGVVWVAPARRRRAGRLHERRRPRRPTRCRRCGAACTLTTILAREIARDRFRATPGDRLLTGLRGKDVLLLFVESYGQGRGPGLVLLARGSTPCSTRAPRSCGRRGFSSRSAFLTSSTFGGLSWLAHSTLQSGIRIGTQRGYDQLVKSDRLTLSAGVQARRLAGGRRRPGEQADVAGGLELLPLRQDLRPPQRRLPRPGLRPAPDARPVRPARPCSASSSPSATGRRSSPRSTSSRATRRGRASPGSSPGTQVGDGSIFDRVPAEESTRAALFGDAERARAAYGHSIEYTMSTIVSFVRHYGDDKTVVVLLGDHQPATIVTGQGATHDVPISVIAHDPKVMRPDRRMGLAGRPAAEPAGAGLADGRVPRPLPHRVRLVAGERLTTSAPTRTRWTGPRGSRARRCWSGPARRAPRCSAGRCGRRRRPRRAPAGTGGAATPRSATS